MSPRSNPLGYVPWWDWQEGKRPPGWTAKDEAHWRGDDIPTPPWWGKPFVPEGGDPDSEEAREARRGIRAWQLAPTLDIYHALMRGENVPVGSLRPEAVKRYGLK